MTRKLKTLKSDAAKQDSSTFEERNTFEHQMKIARRIMAEDREVLAKLAKL